MNLHRYLIHGYRYLTLPLRQQMLAKMKRNGTVPVGILFYHRVDDFHLNPWTITNDRFQEHISWLEKNFDLVSLEEAQRRIRSGYNDRPTISLTFDDGYADNCTCALPTLIQKGIPVTYFVTTKHTLQNQPFDHDVDNGQPLETNNKDMLRSLHRAGVEIGAHTKTHPDLGKIRNDHILFDEVVGSKYMLEESIGCRVRYFAFPFGQHENLNQQVFQICRDNGFEAVCSAYGGWNEIGGDDFHLQRFHGDYRTAWMQNWLTLDPRKRKVKRFEYQLRDKSPKSTEQKSNPFPVIDSNLSATSTNEPQV